MIVDSSVIVCILQDEPERDVFIDTLFDASVRRMAAGTWVELAAVVVRKRLATLDQLLSVLSLQDIAVSAMTAEQAEIAHSAYWRFGIGSGHRARLNFGDCFSYALAIAMDERLLFKGDDFIHTDVRRAI